MDRNPYIVTLVGSLDFTASGKPTKKIDTFPFVMCPDQKSQIQIA